MGNRHQMLLFLSSLPLVVAVRIHAPWSSPSASPTTSPSPSLPYPDPATSKGGAHRAGVLVIGASVGGAIALVCIALFIFWMLRRGHSYKPINIHEDLNLPSDIRTGPLGRGNGKSNTNVSAGSEKQE